MFLSTPPHPPPIKDTPGTGDREQGANTLPRAAISICIHWQVLNAMQKSERLNITPEFLQGSTLFAAHHQRYHSQSSKSHAAFTLLPGMTPIFRTNDSAAVAGAACH
jgi:hypothetical protein